MEDQDVVIKIPANLKYVWVKGDHIGSIEEVNFETSEMVYFTSGRNVYKAIFYEFLSEASDDIVSSLNSALGKPFQPTSTSTSFHSDISPVHSMVSDSLKNPVFDFLKNMKEKSIRETSLSVNISIPMPSPKVLEVLSESFEEDQVSEGLQLYLLEIVEKLNIVSKVKEEIFKMLPK